MQAAALAVRAAGRLPTYTNDRIADYLVDGYWDERSFNLGNSGIAAKNGVLQYNDNALTAAGRALAEKALALYEAVLEVDFVRTDAISAAVVDIIFDDADDGAFTSDTSVAGNIMFSTVNVGLDWLSAYGTTVGSYAFQTYLHEIGHALGLGHAGDYNGNATYVTSTSDPDYGDNSNLYLNDSWQTTMMSYFSQDGEHDRHGELCAPDLADGRRLDRARRPLSAAHRLCRQHRLGLPHQHHDDGLRRSQDLCRQLGLHRHRPRRHRHGGLLGLRRAPDDPAGPGDAIPTSAG